MIAMKDKKLALTLTIELWEKLADAHECNTNDKRIIYLNIREENGIKSDLLRSYCFLCDVHYKLSSGKYGMKPSCGECPLFKSGSGCNITGSTKDTLFTKWRSGAEREERQNAADVMVKALKAL